MATDAQAELACRLATDAHMTVVAMWAGDEEKRVAEEIIKQVRAKTNSDQGYVAPPTTLQEMITEMVDHDLSAARKNRLLMNEGFEVNQTKE